MDVQIYDLDTGLWRMGETALPTRLCLGIVVPYEDSFLIVGGDQQLGTERYTDEILQFIPDTESWLLRDERLSIGRYEHYAALVDGSDFNCA